jgi:predicted dehydrogenase
MIFDGEVLVAGLGSIGERHVRNLRALGQGQIVVLRRAEKPTRTLAESDFVTVTELATALDRKPSAAIICLPNNQHVELLLHCVEAGIPTLVEVPLAHSLEGLAEILRLAEKNAVPLLMGHNLRFHPALAAIKSAVDQGRIGDPLYSRAQFGEWLPGNHPWEDYRQRYEARADLGGGAVLTSIHEIDHAYWLFGHFKSVTAVARTRSLDIDVEDVAMMIFEHRTGVLSDIGLDFVQRVYSRSLQIAGSEGTIQWALLDKTVQLHAGGDSDWTELFSFGSGYDIATVINRTYLDELEHFAAVVRGAAAPNNSLADGIHVLSAGLAALESSKQGHRIDIDAGQTDNKITGNRG